MTFEWNSRKDSKLKKLRAKGATNDEISRVLGASYYSVQARLRRLNKIDGSIESRSNEVSLARWSWSGMELKKMTLEHLLDLKRAGHSPRFTEFHIPSDARAPMRKSQPIEYASRVGSCAGLCADA